MHIRADEPGCLPKHNGDARGLETTEETGYGIQACADQKLDGVAVGADGKLQVCAVGA